MRAADAVVIAGSHRKAVQDVDRMFIQLLPGLAQQVEQGQKQFCFLMPAPVEATFTEHVRHIAHLPQEGASLLVVSAKEQSGNNRSSHDFCIAHPALWIFVMVKCFQKVVTQAINCYNLGVHVFLLAKFWFRLQQLYQETHGLCFSPM